MIRIDLVQTPLSGFLSWLTSLDPKSTLVGAVTLAFLLGIGRYVLVPCLSVLGRIIVRWLYPVLSGAVILDRVWSLPKYRKAIEHRVSEITNPWLNEGQRLSDVFVPVSVGLPESGTDRLELGNLFFKFPRIVIIGDPGSGKTTGLKAIALRCLRGELLSVSKRQLLPVFISLRRLAESKKPLEEYILDEFTLLDFPNASRSYRRLRKQGRLVFLLDGLDEVEEAERSGVFQQVQMLIECQNSDAQRCHILLTSRPVGYDHQLQGAVDRTVRVADFTPADIRKFIDNWEFQAPKSQADLFDSIVTRQPILALCKNPLMLTIVAYLYGNTQYELPHSRDEFYKICLEALLRNWDAAKNIDSRNKIPAARKSAFLERFAFKALKEAKLEFREIELIEQIEAFLLERKYTEVSPERFLLELRRSGLLASLPTGEIFFAHKTLAESLAASHLRNRTAELSDLWKRKPDAWLEVCSLYVADPATDLCDIGILIDDARSTDNWNGALILAGEAHSCPDAQRRWIVEELLPNQSLWPSYDQRAVSALAELSDEEARKVLTIMLRSSDAAVCIRALRTLGLVREEWATRLIVAALTDKTTGAVASETLAQMGPDAIAIVRDLLSPPAVDALTARACLNVLNAVRGAQAIPLILPLLCHANVAVAQHAAMVASEMLSDRRLRQEFEIMDQDKFSQTLTDDARAISDWAVPWVKSVKHTHRAVYAQLISKLRDRIVRREALEHLEPLAARLLIPAFICAESGVLGRYVELVRSRISRTSVFPTNLETGTAFPKLAAICEGLFIRGDLRELWSRVGGGDRKDIELRGASLVLFCLLSIMISTAPLGFAIALARVSGWWASPLGLILIFFLIWYAFEKELMIYLILCPIIAFPGIFLKKVIIEKPYSVNWRDTEEVMSALLVLFLVGTIGADMFGAFTMGGYWWICILPLLISLWFEYEAPQTLILVKRSNPLRKLLTLAEKIEDRRGADTLES